MRVKFVCKSCTNEMTVTELWEDVKPKVCPKCKTNFIKEPEKLLKVEPKVTLQKLEEMEKAREEQRKQEKRKKRR